MNTSRLFLILCCLGLTCVGLGAFDSSLDLEVEGLERKHLVILATTDLHGNVLPKDYYTGTARSVGLAKLATLIKAVRAQYGQGQVLLLDGGDTIQGTPLTYYHARKDNQPIDPMMQVMNHLGYDAMTVGNHEFNFGLEVLRKAEHEAEFPWLSANTYQTEPEQTAFPPYLIQTMQGLRIGVLGITTPGIPAWEDVAHTRGLRFENPVEQAQKWVRHLRVEEGVDLVVVLAHMGLEQNLRTGVSTDDVVPMENAVLRMAQQVEGIDIIFAAHTHQELSGLDVNGVRVVQAGRHGDHLARVDLFVDAGPMGAKLVGIESQLIPVTAAVETDPEVVSLASSYDVATEQWLNQPVGISSRELLAEEARFRDTAIIDLIHRVQLEAADAELSFAASFNDAARIPKGPVTVRDIAGLYIYENTLVVVEMTGRQVLEALEHSALYFRTSRGGEPLRSLVAGNVPGYNFDMVEGVRYQIDLREAPGARIKNLEFEGAPIDLDRKFRVAVNNYRKNGGGGYSMFRDAPVLDRSSTTVRDLIIEWVSGNPSLPTDATGNWELIY